MNKRGLNLVEILTVVIIVGILSSLAYVNYSASRERVFDKEALANLKVLQMAQKDYKLDYGVYYPSSGVVFNMTDINNVLKLALPTGTQRNWSYRVYDNGSACASRVGASPNKYYLICPDEEVAVRRDACSPATYCP